MEKIMDKLKNVIVYIDDLLIHSKTHDDHLVTLDEELQRLTDNNMKINLAKCHFGNTEVSYLGFRLTPEGITPGKDKLKAVEKAKIPETKEGSNLSWDCATSLEPMYKILLNYVPHSIKQQEKTLPTGQDQSQEKSWKRT